MMTNEVINVRSDTVTKPFREMRQAMYEANVGDDGYRTDPTVKELENISAKLLGKKAGLFVTSGTMGNITALMSQANPGESVILESEAHILRCEKGGISSIAGLLPKYVEGEKGIISSEQIIDANINKGVLLPETTLLSIENPHNSAGGVITPKEKLDVLCETAHDLGMNVHIDGARIFNAAICSGVAPSKLVEKADTITFCLSKDLGCPYGSVLVGDDEIISEAREKRQMLGGGIRQGGIMAAAGIYALKNNIERLKEDHEKALMLARGLKELGFKIDMDAVQTNMVFAYLPEDMDPLDYHNKLGKRGIVINPPKEDGRIRFVTHIEISTSEINKIIKSSEEIILNKKGDK